MLCGGSRYEWGSSWDSNAGLSDAQAFPHSGVASLRSSLPRSCPCAPWGGAGLRGTFQMLFPTLSPPFSLPLAASRNFGKEPLWFPTWPEVGMDRLVSPEVPSTMLISS